MAGLSIDQARLLLGVASDCADATVVRRAYLVAIRDAHPDRNSAADANARSAQLTEAYRIVCAALEAGVSLADEASVAAEPAPAPAEPSPPPSPVGTEAESFEIEGWVRVIADDTIELGAPLDLAFRWLELACHRAGDITYLDRPAAMLQLLVQFVGYSPAYVVFDLQGRAAYGTTELFCTIASLDDNPAPPIDAVTEFIAASLDSVLD